MRSLLLSCLLLWLLVPSWTREPRLRLMHPGIGELRAERVALDPRDGRRTRVGALTYLGGITLTSPDSGFVGISALAVSGDRFTLVGDGGSVVRFRMGRDWTIADARFSDLEQGPGAGWEKADRDSEALAMAPDGNTAWVAFENSNAIWRYSGDLARADRSAVPAPMRGWPWNAGAESLVRRRDGSFIALREYMQGPRPDRRWLEGLIFAGDPADPGSRVDRFRLIGPAGWQAADATELPDGRLVVLLRRFGWHERFFASALLIVDGDAVRPGAVVRGRIIAELRRPLIHDNFEGVAATREGGRTILWLVSDDNGASWQRTMLLKFALAEPATKARRAR